MLDTLRFTPQYQCLVAVINVGYTQVHTPRSVLGSCFQCWIHSGSHPNISAW